MIPTIPILRHQHKFIVSQAVHTGLVAGYGAGKTKAATLKIVNKLTTLRKDVAYYLPTYPLIKDIAFPCIADELTVHGIPFVLNRTDKEFKTPYGRIIMRSMDNPDTIVGYEVAYSLIDECDILGKEKMWDVFRKIIARNRIDIGEPNQTDVVGTPEGFKWFYEFFVTNASEVKNLIRAKTTDNPFLPDSFIDTLKESFTGPQLEAYIDGEFVNLTSGTVYYAFDREKNNTTRRVEKNDVLNVGQDFNITKMASVIFVADSKGHHAVDEIAYAFDTAETIRILKERYPNHTIVMWPDASGKNRNTSGKSDIRLLKEAGFKVKERSKNPFVKDRVNSMNAAFCNAKAERSLFVNVAQCPEFTKALEQQGYKNGEPDKTTGLDHINEAGGYYVFGNVKSTERRRSRSSVS